SLSIRSGLATPSTPARRKAAAVPDPTACQCWPGRTRSGCRVAAACAAAGLVNTTKGACSADRSDARASGQSRARIDQGESAITPPPYRAAARRIDACSPVGRREITYHSGGPGRVAWLGIGPASHGLRGPAPFRHRHDPFAPATATALRLHAPGGGDAVVDRRIRGPPAAPACPVVAPRQRQGLRLRRQPRLLDDPGRLGPGLAGAGGGGAGSPHLRCRQPDPLPRP